MGPHGPITHVVLSVTMDLLLRIPDGRLEYSNRTSELGSKALTGKILHSRHAVVGVLMPRQGASGVGSERDLIW